MEKRSALNEGKQSAKRQSTDNDMRIGEMLSGINQIAVDEGGKALLESKIQDLQNRLRKAQDDPNTKSLGGKLQEANAELALVEERREQLGRDLAQGMEKAQERAKLDHLLQAAEDSQKSLDRMCHVHGSRLSDIVSPNWSPSSLGSQYQSVWDKKKEDVKNAEARRDEVSKRRDQVNYLLGVARDDLEKQELEQESCAAKIRTSFVEETKPENYLQAMETAQNNRDTMKADLDNVAYEKDYFRRCLKSLNSRSICKTCERPIKADEKARFEQKINRILATEEEEYQTRFDRYDKELQDARKAASSHVTWLRLSQTEIPKSRNRIKELEKESDGLLARIEEHDRTVDELEESLRDVESLSKQISTIVKYDEDTARNRSQYEELAAKYQDASNERTPQDIQRQIEARNEEFRSLKNQVTRLTAQRLASQTQIATLERELNDAKMNFVTANSQLENKARIEKQIEEARSQNRGHREAIQKLDDQLRDIQPLITEEESKLDDIENRGSKREAELQQHAVRLSDSAQQLNLLSQKLESYIAEGGPAKTAGCQREIETAQREISQIENEQKGIVVEINKLDRELNNQESNKRNIEDNIRCRRKQRDLEQINSRIVELSSQNAEADRDHFEKQSNHWSRQVMLHESAKTSKFAEMRAKNDELTRLIADWDTDYQDAGQRYREAHIKVEVGSPRALVLSSC